MIQWLEDSKGNLHQDETTFDPIILSYFKNIFKSEVSNSNVDWNSVLNFIPNQMSHLNNEILSQAYTEEEIRAALFQINTSKSPRRDGYSGLFYQKFWDIIKTQVIREALTFLNGGELASEHNITQIVLIPKIKNPVKITDFRPISLCSVFPKSSLISRVLLNRIHPSWIR